MTANANISDEMKGVVEGVETNTNPSDFKAEVERIAKEFKKKFLGKIPINTKLRESADLGLPLTYKEPDHEVSKIFSEIAKRITEDAL